MDSFTLRLECLRQAALTFGGAGFSPDETIKTAEAMYAFVANEKPTTSRKAAPRKRRKA